MRREEIIASSPSAKMAARMLSATSASTAAKPRVPFATPRTNAPVGELPKFQHARVTHKFNSYSCDRRSKPIYCGGRWGLKRRSSSAGRVGGTQVLRRRRTGRFPGAIVISALAHGGLLALAIWSVSDEVMHTPAGSSGGEAGSVTVTLVGPPNLSGGGQAPQASSKAATDLDAIFQKFHSEDSPPSAKQDPAPKGGAAKLFQEIADARQKATGQSKADHPANAEGPSDGYDLWARIRPCWRRTSATVVTLDVGVDSQGRLAWPPRPVRTSPAPPSPRELLAESMAVQAAVRCAPFHDAAPAMGAKTFRITFSG